MNVATSGASYQVWTALLDLDDSNVTCSHYSEEDKFHLWCLTRLPANCLASYLNSNILLITDVDHYDLMVAVNGSY